MSRKALATGEGMNRIGAAVGTGNGQVGANGLGVGAVSGSNNGTYLVFCFFFWIGSKTVQTS
jgi:hypothetical protein